MTKGNKIGLCLTLIMLLPVYRFLFSDQHKDKQTAVEMSQIQISDGKMTPEALLALGRLSDPQVSPDGKRILYGVSYTSIEENRSCRQLFICKLDGSDKVQISNDGSSINCARWFDDNNIVYLQKGAIWSAKLRKNGKLGKRICLSDVPEGISEFSISPDGKKIMYISSVKGSVKTAADVYPELDKAEVYTATDLMHRHWDHWVTEIPHTYISDFDIKAAKSICRKNSTDILGADSPYELPTEPFSGIEQLSWSPDGSKIAYSCRTKTGRDYAFSTNSDIYIYDIASAESINVSNGGGYDTDPVWSPSGERLAWISMERDGYEADQQRLMLVNINNINKITCVSKGFDRNVSGLVWENDACIWFNALSDGLQGIFRAVELMLLDDRCAEDTAPNSEAVWDISRVTAENDWHDYSSPFHIDGDKIYCTWQSMNFPSEIVCINTEGGKTESIQISNENGHILSQLTEPQMEARMIKTVDGKDMLTWVMYPPQFDSTKTYPAITICLGGPQGTLSQSWSYRWCYRLMAEQGYIVVMPNRRGTTAFGQEWCEQISGDYSGLNIEDYKSAARALKAEPYVGKMAACGASYGGYSVYYLAGHNEDELFDCFIAHAGIFNEEHMYYTTEEMWFPEFDNGGLGKGYLSGSPWSKEEKAVKHYRMSPHKFVENWHTPILCIHGGMDYRVPVDEGMAAFNCARMMGVEAEMVIFPYENHWILKPQNALYWHRRYFNWLDRWCR